MRAMRLLPRLLLLLGSLAGTGCASLSQGQRDAAAQIAHAARSTQVDCTQPDACALPSPVLALAKTPLPALVPAAKDTAADAPAMADTAPDHRALILDDAPDALLLRIHLIRAATRSIDLQTYIFDEDDAAQLVLDELQAAAFRGVRVRLLVDQLAALRKVETLAALSSLHANLEVRVYNPVLDRGRLSLPMYAVAAACCWRQLNRRMHNKLLLVDGALGITGGRNYQDDYYDWGESYNFRDRDLLLAGPAVADMAANFDAFWESRRSVPAERLGDVARYLRRYGPPPPPHHPYRRPERVRALLADVADDAVLSARFVAPVMPVRNVRFIADLPAKHRRSRSAADGLPNAGLPAASLPAASLGLMGLLANAHHEILLQTPYLVLSRPAQRLFRDLRRQPQPPRVRVSTNSLAATDAFIAYALSYKYKRRYLRDFGFEIHEFKPFPADAPFEFGATGAGLADDEAADATSIVTPADAMPDMHPGSSHRPGARERLLAERGLLTRPVSEAGRNSPFASAGGMPVRLKRAGIRMGLHAKSLVVDGKVGAVGTHNFDPRGDTYNTESAVVIDDPAFAQALAASIRRDMRPANAWTIGRRDAAPVLSGVDYNLARVSEELPVFDLWPFKYATSYDYVPGPECPADAEPPSPFAPDFRRCHRPVGDFPDVDLGLKWLGVRVFTGFGSGLAPIL